MPQHGPSATTDADVAIKGLSHTQLRAILNTNIAAVTVLNSSGQIIFANQAAELILGLNRSDITHLNYDAPEWHIQNMDGGEMPSEELPFHRVMTEGLAVEDIRHAIVWPNGDKRFLSISAAPLPADIDNPESEMLVVAGVHDVTEEHSAKREVEEHSLILKKLISHLPGMIFKYHLRTDGSSSFVYTSDGCYDIFGLHPAEVMENAGKAFEIIHPDDLEKVTRAITASATDLSPWYSEYRINHPNGDLIWVEGQSTPERLEDGSTLWHGYIHIITKRKLLETELERLATTDGLTNLLNRREFEARASTELYRLSRSPDEESALLMLDLDHFKKINDRYGHSAGDTVLITLSRLLEDQTREHDLVARIGGEEFVILLSGIGIDDVQEKADCLRQLVEGTSFSFGQDASINVTASIGCTGLRAGDTDVSKCLSRADDALYDAKRQGRNRVVLNT